MRTRGQFSKPAPFNYQSHQSLQKFRKVPVEQRADQVVQDIFKIKLKGESTSKLILAKNTPPSKQDEIKQLKKQIKFLESELKKKVLENPILSRIFKTKQPTNGQMAHLDLYLEFVKLKEEQQNNQAKIQQVLESHKQKQMAYQLEISQLKDEMQRKQQKFIRQIEKASQKFQKLQKEFQKKIYEKEKMFEQQTIERESKIQDNNLILEELKRKNHKLAKQNKENETRLNEYTKSEQERIKSLKVEFQSYKQKTSEERTGQQEEIQKNKKQSKAMEETLKNKICQLENELAQKALQIQQLDRFIELQNESYQTKIHEIETSQDAELRKVKEQNQSLLFSQKSSTQAQIKDLIRSQQEKLTEVKAKYENQIRGLKQKSKKDDQKITQLELSLQENQKALKKLHQDIKKYSQEAQIQIQTLKASNNNLTEQKELITKKLTQSQIKAEKLTKQVQFLAHQKNQIHSKYEKGFINSQNDVKHCQSIIDQLQRKIYMLGNENIGLKKSIEQKTNTQNKVKEFNRISEETYQQKYKTIGRIEEIRHKLQNFMLNDFTRGFSNNFTMSSNNYRSNNSNNQPSVSLTDSIEGLTMALDKLCDHYSSLNQAIEYFKKQKQEDEREIELILNHFLDMEERQAELEEALINYINLRKELNKQQTANTGIYCGDEYLIEKKRQICQFAIEKLIQLKVIKQYSSADQGISSYRIGKDYHYGKRPEEAEFTSCQSSNNYFMPSANNVSLNSRRSLKNLVMQEQYRSNEDFVRNDDCYDSLEMTKYNKPNALLEANQSSVKERKSMAKGRQLSKSKGAVALKYQRMSTQPSKCQDGIEEQSTYEINDENVDYGNLRRRQASKPKVINEKIQYNSGNMTATKEQLNKKYRDQIKEKLISGKGKRENGTGLSKEDIEKKYFMR